MARIFYKWKRFDLYNIPRYRIYLIVLNWKYLQIELT